MQQVISSLSNGQIKYINLLLKKPRARKEENAFVVEGIKMFEESRTHGNLIKAYFSEEFYSKKEKEEPEFFNDLSYEIIQDSIFKRISDTISPQGVLAIVEKPSYDLSNVLANPKASLLLLENIQDPGNLGTMVRTAEGAGFTGVILSSDCVDILNPKVIRSTMGAIYRMPFVYVDVFEATLREVKKNDISIYAAHLDGASYYDEVEYAKKRGILIGNESKGLKETTAKIADKMIKIPMQGRVESLNAAVAAAIIMYEVARQDRFS